MDICPISAYLYNILSHYTTVIPQRCHSIRTHEQHVMFLPIFVFFLGVSQGSEQKCCIAWTCLIMYEHRERLSFRQKASRTLAGEYDAARYYMCARSAGFWSGAQCVVGEEPGWVGAG